MIDIQLHILFFIKYLKTRFLYDIFCKLQNHCVRDTYLLFDHISANNCECVESYSLFKYMQKNNIKSKYVINSKNCSFSKIKKEVDMKNVIIINDLGQFFPQIFLTLLKTHTVISSFGTISYDRFFKNNKYINYVFLEHGITMLKPIIKSSYTPSSFDYFVITSSQECQTLLTLSKWEDKNLIKTGLPRLDTLKKQISNKQKCIFIMFTMRNFVHNYTSQSYYIKKLQEFLTSIQLWEILKDNNIKLRFAAHYHIQQQVLEKLEDIEILSNLFEFVSPENISENINTADLFITDFSSLAFSFMYINTPVIFYRLDADCNDKNYLEMEYINYAKTKDKYLYNVFYDIEGTLQKIKYYIEHNFVLEKEHSKINSEFFDYVQRGKIAQNLINKLETLKKS